jgi:hypothetical protein
VQSEVEDARIGQDVVPRRNTWHHGIHDDRVLIATEFVDDLVERPAGLRPAVQQHETGHRVVAGRAGGQMQTAHLDGAPFHRPP